MRSKMTCKIGNNPFYCYPSDAKAGQNTAAITSAVMIVHTAAARRESKTPVKISCAKNASKAVRDDEIHVRCIPKRNFDRKADVLLAAVLRLPGRKANR